MSSLPLRSLHKSRGDFIHIKMVSTTVIKKRPEIDASPQDENIHKIIFTIGYNEAPFSSYKYASEAMGTLHLAFVGRIAKWKLLSFRVVEEKRELSVEEDFRTGRFFHYLYRFESIPGPWLGHSVVISCLPGALQGKFYPLPVVKVPPL